MLRVTTIHASTAGASARYYTRYLADDTPEGGGRWLGRQAEGLGLSGGVSTVALEALLSGHDPVSGTRLGTALVDRVDRNGSLIRAVAGYDATFSAPKSVSLLWGLTGDDGIVEAHDIAVGAVLDHLERYGATTRVRVNGVRQHPDSEGLTMAVFGQATSREDDPQLHTHAVISAKVQTADGRWMAVDGRYLKRKQRPLGGLYQSVLRAELSHRYGIAWGPIVNGQAEIAGVPGELLELFSKRTAQVDAALAANVAEFRDREGRDPTRWERAALTRQAAADSRAAKTHLSAQSLSARWADEAAAAGWTPARLLDAVRVAARETPEPAASVAVGEVVELLSAGGSTWMRADVLGAVCDLARPVSQLSGRDWAAAVDQACSRVMEVCVSLDPDTAGPVRGSDGRSVWLAPIEAHLSHHSVVAQEERILAFAAGACDAAPTPSASLERGGLDPLQADAAAGVAGHDGLVLVVGPAGAGETTMLRRAAEDLRSQRRPVFAVAPTAKAAKVLRSEASIPAETIAKLLYELEAGTPGWRAPPGTTLIVDEAGMCGTNALDKLSQLAVSEQWRLVLVGDPRQLHAVGRGGIFDELCRTGPAHHLAVIHRFAHRWEQQASLQLRAANPAALDAYFAHDRVSTGDFAELAADTARQWAHHSAAGRSVAVVAETNEHVDALNAAIQTARRQTGELGDRAVRVAGSEIAQEGDIVVTRRNNRHLRTDRGEPVRNRDRWIVAAVHDDAAITVSHQHGHGTIRLPADYVRAHVRLGYAATAHGHQGDTVDIALTVATEATTHRSLYVGATRGRHHNQILVVTDEADQARDVLERVLTNDRADTPAVVQRRHLAASAPAANRAASPTNDTALRRELDEARHTLEPYLAAIDGARAKLRDAETNRNEVFAKTESAPRWRRRSAHRQLDAASAAVTDAQAELHDAERHARPHRQRVRAAQQTLRNNRRTNTIDRITGHLQQLLEQQPPVPQPAPTPHHQPSVAAEIEPPGIEL